MVSNNCSLKMLYFKILVEDILNALYFYYVQAFT